MIRRLSVNTTEREQMLDVTAQVQAEVRAAGFEDGVLTVFVPHTTAGVTINEDADPSVVRDIMETLARLVPRDAPHYKHMEGNSDAHIKSSLVGHSVQVLVQDGKLMLGTWQGIYFCEFDGPRRRQIWLKFS